jgi:kinesin family protein C2/C3
MQADIQRLRGEVDSQRDAVEAACAAAAQADCQRLQQRLEEVEALVAEKDASLQELRAATDSSVKAKAAQEAALHSQLTQYRQQLDDLANLDERYRRIVEENRNLYNLVQDLRGNIRVFCRWVVAARLTLRSTSALSA